MTAPAIGSTVTILPAPDVAVRLHGMRGTVESMHVDCWGESLAMVRFDSARFFRPEDERPWVEAGSACRIPLHALEAS